ncbi:MAG: ATP-binding protein [Pseudomonadota bacterium]|nr:ATP-binding protein [Pseudomonadota bacterium]
MKPARDTQPTERRVVVLAPQGRDAEVVLLVLKTAGYDGVSCITLTAFIERLNEGAAVGIITEETLAGDDLPALRLWMARQPPWSDFPLLVLATRQAGRRTPDARATLDSLGNVVLLERPLNAETLSSATRAAARSRARQYDTRFHLMEQQRIHRENERLYAAESRALREAAESRDAVLAAERRAREQAEQAGRTKDEFLATLSHELRTPLSAILGWVYVLKSRPPSAADLAKGVDVIERNARAQARLIDELLDMSRIIAGNVALDQQPLDPCAVVESAMASIQPSADAKSLVLRRAIDASVGLVSADPHRLTQIIWNLLSNAVKFTPAGGSIEVAVRREHDQLAVEIRDSGEGVPADFLPFIFDRFRQADGSSARRHGGLGLGLSIVRNLVELHRGTIRAASDGPGKGTTLVLHLPLLPPDTQAAAVPPLTAPADATPTAPGGPPAPELQGAHVVVVDDELDSREMIGRILGERGARVRLAGSADEAVATVEAGPVDLLVSDIGMPGQDGHALLRRLRGLGHLFPAIAVTAFARGEDARKALATGFAHHLAKPFEGPQLVALAISLIDGGRRGAVARPAHAASTEDGHVE